MLTTTETLLKGLAAGDESRWARFYRDYAPFLESVVLNKYSSMSHADAEEIVSETMIDIAKMMPTYHYDKEKKGAFHSLLAKIAQNKAIDRFRKDERYAAKLERFAAEMRRYPIYIQGKGTLKCPDLTFCEVHLGPGVTFITSGRFKPDGYSIKEPVPPPDADWNNRIGYPTYVVEPGAKLIFTENYAYPLALIRHL